MKHLVALLLVMLIPASVLAAPEAKQPPAIPRITKITKVAVGPCSTDGGGMPCPAGVKYLGEVIQSSWNNDLNDKPITCADAKAGSFTFRFDYEYNEGTTSVADDEKVQAKWPACVKELSKQVAVKYLEWFKMLRTIDTRIDVRSAFKVTVAIK